MVAAEPGPRSGPSAPGSYPPAEPETDGYGSEDRPVLPERTDDEHDVGWGDEPGSGRRDEDWYRRERPPHHE